jgi:hypothetical protein
MKVKTIGFGHLKLLKDGFMWDGVEGFHYIHLEHHLVGVDI